MGQRMIVNTARAAADLLVPLFASAGTEKVITAHLDAEQQLIRTIEAENGSHGEVELPIRSIISDALRFESAALIIAHNHLSGDPTPSKSDLAATRLLVTTATGLGIQVYDHLVVGANGECRSLRALGLL